MGQYYMVSTFVGPYKNGDFILISQLPCIFNNTADPNP
jgi:hypothetical protein